MALSLPLVPRTKSGSASWEIACEFEAHFHVQGAVIEEYARRFSDNEARLILALIFVSLSQQQRLEWESRRL